MNVVGLCNRCEHRTRFRAAHEANEYETRCAEREKRDPVLVHKPRPRMECGDLRSQSCGCYMYKPVLPVVLERQKGDKRPLAPGYFSARFHGVRVASPEEASLYSEYVDDDTMFDTWVPKRLIKLLVQLQKFKEKVLRERREAKKSAKK